MPLLATLNHRDASEPALTNLPIPLNGAFQEAAYLRVIDAVLFLFRLPLDVADSVAFRCLMDHVITYHTFTLNIFAAASIQPDKLPSSSTLWAPNFFLLACNAAYPRDHPGQLSEASYLTFWSHMEQCHVTSQPHSTPLCLGNIYQASAYSFPHLLAFIRVSIIMTDISYQLPPSTVFMPHIDFLPNMLVLSHLLPLGKTLMYCSLLHHLPYYTCPLLDPRPP